MALVLINPQVHLFEPDPVYNGPVVLERLVALTTRARAAGVSVVFVRHNGGPDDPDAPPTPGWPIARGAASRAMGASPRPPTCAVASARTAPAASWQIQKLTGLNAKPSIRGKQLSSISPQASPPCLSRGASGGPRAARLPWFSQRRLGLARRFPLVFPLVSLLGVGLPSVFGEAGMGRILNRQSELRARSLAIRLAARAPFDASGALGDKVWPWLHVPAQSGSDGVLRRIWRGRDTWDGLGAGMRPSSIRRANMRRRATPASSGRATAPGWCAPMAISRR